MDSCPFSKDEIMQFVISALRDPHNPTHCSGSLLMAVRILTPTTTSSTDKEEFRKMKQLCKTLFHFIIAKRAQGQVAPFLEQFSKCTDCSGQTPPTNPTNSISVFFHLGWANHMGRFKSDFLWFSTFIANKKRGDAYPANSCIFIASVFRLLDLALVEVDFKAAARGVSKLWPTKMVNLIPDGPDALVASILQWYRIHPDPVILKFTATITSLCRSLIHPSLIKHKITNLAADSTKQVLDLCLAVFSSKEMTPDTLPLCDTYTQQSCAFFDFVQALIQEQLPGDAVLKLLNGCESKVIQLCSIILYLGPRSMRYMSMSMMASSGGNMSSISTLAQQKFHYMAIKPSELTSALCRALRTQVPNAPRPNIRIALPMVFRDRETYFGSEKGLEADIALGAFWSNGINYGCLNRLFSDCQNSFEGAGKNLKACDQCLGVYYCGPRCQSEDWKASEYSHKQMCPILRKIVQASGSAPATLSSDSSRSLQAKIKAAESDVAKIKAVRLAVRRAKLNSGEMTILHGFGKKLYGALVLETLTWSPGYEDYDACINQVTDRQRFAVAGSPEAGLMSKTPSEEIKKEKATLIARKFWS